MTLKQNIQLRLTLLCNFKYIKATKYNTQKFDKY